MNTLKKIKANQKGFTLVELIVVVAILGVLAAVAAPNYMNYLYKSRVNADISSARAVINAARTMYMTSSSAPSLAEVMSDADMSNTLAASAAGTLQSVMTLTYENVDGTDQFVATVAAGDKAGKYAGSYRIEEFGELPQATVNGGGTTGGTTGGATS